MIRDNQMPNMNRVKGSEVQSYFHFEINSAIIDSAFKTAWSKILFSKTTSNLFANSIINILSDQKLSSELGRNGRKIFLEKLILAEIS